jgi:ParB/RepB/Spo0J family partition protein
MRAKEIALGRQDMFQIPIKLLTIIEDEDLRLEIGDDLEELAKDIAARGQLEAIKIRPYNEGGAEKYAIVSGRRRYRAVLRANKKYLDNEHQIEGMKCIFEEKNTTPDDRIINEVSSNNRTKPFTDLELGYAFKRLRDEFSWSVKRIAESSGRSKPWVINKIELAEAPGNVQDAIKEGKVKPTTAKKIIHSSKKTQETAMLKADFGEKITGKDVEKLEEAAEKETPKEIDISIIIDGLLLRGFQRLSENKDKVFNTVIRIERKDPPLIDVLGC